MSERRWHPKLCGPFRRAQLSWQATNLEGPPTRCDKDLGPEKPRVLRTGPLRPAQDKLRMNSGWLTELDYGYLELALSSAMVASIEDLHPMPTKARQPPNEQRNRIRGAAKSLKNPDISLNRRQS